MSSAGTLVNMMVNTPSPSPLLLLSSLGVPLGPSSLLGFDGGENCSFGVAPQDPFNMLDLKMSSAATSEGSPGSSCSGSTYSSSAPSHSPVTPVNILSECYIGMWENDMSHPPPTKMETADIMDLIEPTSHSIPGGDCAGLGSPGPSSPTSTSRGMDGGTSPTAVIHHPAGVGSHTTPLTLVTVGVSGNSPSVGSPHCSTSPHSSSPTSSSSQYLVPLPSLGDPYGTPPDPGPCHLLDTTFHSSMDGSYHKLSDPSHAFQDGGYDAFISDLSQSHDHHHTHVSSSLHSHHNLNGHHQSHDNGVLLLDMNEVVGGAGPSSSTSSLHHSHHHHHHHQHPHHSQHVHALVDSTGECSPGCSCLHYGSSSSLLGGGDPFEGGVSHHHLHPHPSHHDIQRHHEYWDDLHGTGPMHGGADLTGDYSISFRKGESPTTPDSLTSYATDNDSESKSSSSVGGSSLSEVVSSHHSHHHPLHLSSPPPPPVKRKVGRPPKKDKKPKRNGNTEKKTGRLWEFIRDLLKNPKYCPSLVKWENHEEGHFRFVNSEKVAQLWGEIKSNPRMTYEKLSRAMRYYYKSHVFEPVLGRRLVYKFGYNATNWKPINPNFASSVTSSASASHLHHLHHHPTHYPLPHPHQQPPSSHLHPQKMYN